jgi:hypothetical protein
MKHTSRLMEKVNLILAAIGKCQARMPDMSIKILKIFMRWCAS